MLQKFLVVALAVIFTTACPSSNNHYNKKDKETSYYDVTPADQSELETQIGNKVFFDYNSSELTAKSKSTLDKQAEWLKDNPAVTISVEGHADERGTKEYNVALGERRAYAVKNYLVSQGVNSDRIYPNSYGSEKPEVLGTGEAVWSQNRRVVSIVNGRTL